VIREARGQGRTVEGPSGKEMAEVLAEVWAAVIEELERIDGEAGAGAGATPPAEPAGGRSPATRGWASRCTLGRVPGRIPVAFRK
jgi:hypothetical protein